MGAWYLGGIVGYNWFKACDEMRVNYKNNIEFKPIVPPKMLYLHLKAQGVESGLDERDPKKSEYYTKTGEIKVPVGWTPTN